MRDKSFSIRRTVGRLRASHEAMRVAQAVEYRTPVERPTARCERCGREIDVMNLNLDFVPEALTCPRCGDKVRVPTYVRGVVLRTPKRRHFRKPWQDYSSERADVYNGADYSSPASATAIFVACLLLIAGLLIYVAL